MTIYFISLSVVVLLAYTADRYSTIKTSKRFLIFLVFLTMVLLAGLRSGHVGTDTNNYIRFFDGIGVSLQKAFSAKTSFRPGFTVITVITRNLSDNYLSFLLIIAIVAVYFQLSAIYKTSKLPVISLFVLITMGFYTFFFNGARQGLALAIFMMSIGAIINGNPGKFAFWILFGSLFHPSILFILPFYFLFRIKISIWYFLLILISLSLVFFLFEPILSIGDDILSERYSQYLDRGQTGAEALTLFFTVLTLFLIWLRGIIAKNEIKEYDVLLSMTIIGTMIYIIVYFLKLDVNIIRLSNYFHLAIVFIWPIIFRNIKGTIKFAFGLSFFLIHIAFFTIQLLKFSNMVPYTFNPMI